MRAGPIFIAALVLGAISGGSPTMGSGRAWAATEVEFIDAPEPDTPRRAVERFLDAVHEGRYTDATSDLYLRPENKAAANELARKLAAVLDNQTSQDSEWLSRVSDQPTGHFKEASPTDKEEIGRVPGRRAAEPVRMRPIRDPDGATRWKFTDGTAMRARQWYLGLNDLWLREHLPHHVLVPGPRGLLIWEWLALPIFLVASIVVGLLGSLLIGWLLRPLLRRSRAKGTDLLLQSLRRPLRLFVASLLLGEVMPYLLISPAAERFVHRFARVGIFLGVFWAVWKCVDVVVKMVRESSWLRSHPSAMGVIPLGYRLAEVTVLAVAFIMALQELGYPVTSLVAGLGLGGLAVALAAQKTVEHLFGGVMVSLDQPMRIGDLVIIDGREGWVEHIGLRSTSIRTLDRSLLTIPNGKLADMVIESLAARDRMRLHIVLGVAYELSSHLLDKLRSKLLHYLRTHPRLTTELPLRVHFMNLGNSSLDIEIMAWFEESDWDRFLELRHEVLIGIMRVLEAEGAHVAFPTSTVHLIEKASASPMR